MSEEDTQRFPRASAAIQSVDPAPDSITSRPALEAQLEQVRRDGVPGRARGRQLIDRPSRASVGAAVEDHWP